MRAVVLASVLALATPAHAKMFWRPLGKLIADATSVEVVEVDSVAGSILKARMVEGFRSTRAVGERVELDLGALDAHLKPGERVLVICDAGMCPRATGVLRDGWFVLGAQEPGDGALVEPNLVSHVALPALVAGKPAPPLCVKGTLAFHDDATPRALELAVPVTTGRGTGTLGGRAIVVSVSGGEGVTVHLDARFDVSSRTIAVVAHRGCFAGRFTVDDDGPRGYATAIQVLDGKPVGRQVFARGALVIAGTRHALTLATDGDAIVLASDLASGRADWRGSLGPVSMLGFPVGEGATFPRLKLAFETAAHSYAWAFADKGGLDVAVSRVDTESGTDVPLGVARMTYVKQP